jgi:U3 small nucleolar RNA-associated protein 24
VIPRKKAKEEQKKVDQRKKAFDTNPNELRIKELPQEHSNMFLNVNTALGPPYRIILDTNFLNFSIMNKLDIFKNSMDCLFGKCTFS